MTDSLDYADDRAGRSDINALALTEEEETRRRELHTAAVHFWELGFRVIPLHWMVATGQCSCGKEDCQNPGKHPLNGKWQKPTTAADTDSGWWRMLAANEQNPVDWSPRSNIGILTGEVSGIFVLDVDCKETDGFATLARAEAQHPDEPIPNTLMVQTGSGGRHYYFRHPGRNVGNVKPWGKHGGVDIKGDGGMVVAVPSLSGYGPYTFAANITDVSQIAAAPSWLLELIQEHGKQQHGEPSKISPAAAPDGLIRAYASAAMARNAKALAEAPGGSRNDTLNNVAFNLGQLAPAGITNEDQCRELLYEAASKCGMRFVADGVEGTFNSGWRSGMQNPFCPSWAEKGGGEYKLHDWTEYGLADRLMDRFGDTLRWASDTSRWMSWQSGQWETDSKEAAEWLARPVIEALVSEEAEYYSDEAEAKGELSPRAQFLKWARSCRNSAAAAGAARSAKANPSMRLKLGNCDANPLWINCRNGVYDAGTGSFHEHDPDQMLTMRAGVSYDPEATCPRWDAFLKQMQPDAEMRAYLYRCWGYSMTGDTSEQAVFFHHGEGSNGKSVSQDVMSSIAGGYGQVTPVETLLTSRSKQGRIPNDVARMRGKRFLKCSETAEGRRLDEPLIKSLTGNEELVARFMRSEFFQFRMLGKVHLSSNFLIHIGDDKATWNRVHLIPWLVTIPEEQKNKYLAQELFEAEASGIFNRLLAGLADWRARGGLMPPKAAQEAIEAYRKQENTLGRFLDDACTIDLTHVKCHTSCRHETRAHEIWLAYKYWCAETNEDAMKRNSFYKALERRKFVKVDSNQGNRFPQLPLKLFTSGTD